MPVKRHQQFGRYLGDLSRTFRTFSERLGDHILFGNLMFPGRLGDHILFVFKTFGGPT